MRRLTVLAVAAFLLSACASSRHATTQKIGVRVIPPGPADVERFYGIDIGSALAKTIASDFSDTIGPVDLDPSADCVPVVTVSVVWERYGAATSREEQDVWFTLNYRLRTANGVREGSIPAWGVKPSTYPTVTDENQLVIARAVAALRTAIQKSL